MSTEEELRYIDEALKVVFGAKQKKQKILEKQPETQCVPITRLP